MSRNSTQRSGRPQPEFPASHLAILITMASSVFSCISCLFNGQKSEWTFTAIQGRVEDNNYQILCIHDTYQHVFTQLAYFLQQMTFVPHLCIPCQFFFEAILWICRYDISPRLKQPYFIPGNYYFVPKQHIRFLSWDFMKVTDTCCPLSLTTTAK